MTVAGLISLGHPSSRTALTNESPFPGERLHAVRDLGVLEEWANTGQPTTEAERLGMTATHDIGSRRELFTDLTLVDRLEGSARQNLHAPESWEGNTSGYHTVC